MTAELRNMLDELMGRDRDLSMQEKEKQQCHWSDENVCKMFLVRFCPHDLFTNTKADLGPCKHDTHDVKIRECYRNSNRHKRMGYEQSFLRTLEGIVDDMERKIKRQHERLEHDERYMKQEQARVDTIRQERLNSLTTEIDDILEKMAQAGSEGNVDEAQSMMKQVEQLRQEREVIKNSKNEDPANKVFLVKQNVPFINEMKHMEVCIVCGAFLVVNDTQTRVDAHLSGKQHVGYKMIREAISELKAEKEADDKAAEEARKARLAAREEEDKSKKEGEKEEKESKEALTAEKTPEQSRSRRNSRERSKSRRDDRDRNRDDRDRGRDDKDRHRSDRDRHRDDRDRRYREDRSRRDRDRERDRDRDRRRRPSRDRSRERRRSRDRDRSRRSRDKERRESRDKETRESRDKARRESRGDKHDKEAKDEDKKVTEDNCTTSEEQSKESQVAAESHGKDEVSKTIEENGISDKRRSPSRSPKRRSDDRSRRSRSRSRDRKRRSRSRSHDRSHRSRDRSRSRDRKRTRA